MQKQRRFEKFLANVANDDNAINLNDCRYILHCFLVKAISVTYKYKYSNIFFSFCVFLQFW